MHKKTTPTRQTAATGEDGEDYGDDDDNADDDDIYIMMQCLSVCYEK